MTSFSSHCISRVIAMAGVTAACAGLLAAPSVAAERSSSGIQVTAIKAQSGRAVISVSYTCHKVGREMGGTVFLGGEQTTDRNLKCDGTRQTFHVTLPVSVVTGKRTQVETLLWANIGRRDLRLAENIQTVTVT